ncbi:hypothetical protein [Paenibacillus sedimenti]|uniref:Uncharacterized protein n=1 Tax=Paenibacillus sedimenti TaxID=2770274 RepID=A0A926QJ58_9BACL|nr:hypothetical protein [Paenibacillus sedimenti]MBD0381220.1 hypothetical protein [Paenibacillus sedimenti]
MRTADETIELFMQALNKRRAYLRRRIDEIQKQGRALQPHLAKALRSGMLCEITTVECLLKLIQDGKIHPDEIYNSEDDVLINQ